MVRATTADDLNLIGVQAVDRGHLVADAEHHEVARERLRLPLLTLGVIEAVEHPHHALPDADAGNEGRVEAVIAHLASAVCC